MNTISQQKRLLDCRTASSCAGSPAHIRRDSKSLITSEHTHSTRVLFLRVKIMHSSSSSPPAAPQDHRTRTWCSVSTACTHRKAERAPFTRQSIIKRAIELRMIEGGPAPHLPLLHGLRTVSFTERKHSSKYSHPQLVEL